MHDRAAAELVRALFQVVRELFLLALSFFALASAYGWWTASDSWMLWGAQGAAITITIQTVLAFSALAVWLVLRVVLWWRRRAA